MLKLFGVAAAVGSLSLWLGVFTFMLFFTGGEVLLFEPNLLILTLEWLACIVAVIGSVLLLCWLVRQHLGCRYCRVCDCYSKDSVTCRDGGGSYCGKYRALEEVYCKKRKRNARGL